MAAGSTYTPIATTTLSSAASSYTFSSIPSTYTDLYIVAQAGINTSNDDLYLQFNSDTASNYSSTIIYGNGTSAVSTRTTNATGIPCNWAAALNTAGLYTVYNLNIMNYSNTTTYKTTVNRAGSSASTNPGVDAIIGLWRSTSAITSIKLYTPTRTLSVGSTFTLYGITAA